MTGKTHIAGGVLVGVLAMKAQGIEFDASNMLMAMPAITLSSLAPDIDHMGSKLGRKFPLIAMLLTHRNETHRIYALIFFAFILLQIPTLPKWLTITCILAYGSHLVLDILTPDGLDLFEFFGLFDVNIVFPITKIIPEGVFLLFFTSMNIWLLESLYGTG